MENKQTTMDKKLDEVLAKFDGLFDKLDQRYVKKEDINTLKEDLQERKDGKKRLLWIVVSFLTVAVMTLAWEKLTK